MQITCSAYCVGSARRSERTMHDWSSGSGSTYYPRVLFRSPRLTRSAVETLLRSSMMVAYLFGAIRELKSG
jgi:hypothetical protein